MLACAWIVGPDKPGHDDVKSAACDSIIVDRRLSDGTFGVYYCAAELETAIGETVRHFEAFACDSGDPARVEDMRVLAGAVAEDFEDVAALAEPYLRQVLDPHDCSVAQTYARGLRDAGAMGAVYASVRRASGTCVGAFKPCAVGLPHEERHLKYRWNGDGVDRYFDYRQDTWVAL